jgi:methyl-accepting chemotaxis protein
MAQRIKLSSKAIKEINDNFEAIVETASAMGDKIENITVNSREALENLENISANSRHNAESAQGVAATCEQTSAASEELGAQAKAMRDVAARLRVFVDGSAQTKDDPYPQEKSQQLVSRHDDFLKPAAPPRSNHVATRH